jgi:mRNA-degrading endonuclease RelE of RelBE toxin-antitoxin system
MKTGVTLDEQPLKFIRQQAPDSRRALREALHAVEAGKTFPEPLEDQLQGFYKLKVAGYRMILQAVPGGSGPGLRVIFAERRSGVYVLFSQLMSIE